MPLLPVRGRRILVRKPHSVGVPARNLPVTPALNNLWCSHQRCDAILERTSVILWPPARHLAHGRLDALIFARHRLDVEPTPRDAVIADPADDHPRHIQIACVRARAGPPPLGPLLIIVLTVAEQPC